MNYAKIAIGLALLMIVSAGAVAVCDANQADAATLTDIEYDGTNFITTISEATDGSTVQVRITGFGTWQTERNAGVENGVAIVPESSVQRAITAGEHDITIRVISGGMTEFETSRWFYAINFEVGEGTGSQPGIVVTEGFEYTLPAFADTTLVAPSGQQFLYWDVNGERVDAETKYTITETTTITPVYGDPSTVQYDIDAIVSGGNGTVTTTPAGQTTAGRTVTVYPDPDGGYQVDTVIVNGGDVNVVSNGDGTYSFIMPAENVEVIVTFTEISTVTVTFISDGQTVSRQSVDYGASVSAPAVTKTGYTLQAWADGEGITYDFPMFVTADLTVYAQWEPNTYTIVFDGSEVGVTGSTTSMDMAYDVAMNLSPNGFALTGHHFIGWSTTADGEVVYENGESVENLTDVDGATVTLYAQWAPDEYLVSFDANGGEGMMTSVSVTYGDSYEVPTSTFTLDGYTFDGWNTQANGEGIKYAVGADIHIVGPVTLYAMWVPIEYTIAFDANGGEGTMESMQMTYGEQRNLSPNSFEYEGFNFIGWNTSEDGTGTKYADKALVSNLTTEAGATVTLYAQWDEVPVTTHVVTFDLGYEGAGSSTTNVVDGQPVSRPKDPIRDGYTFSGWYLDDEPYDFDTPVTGPIILVAQWVKIPVLESIEVTVYPTKTVYTVGDPLDLKGMVVTAKYSDGSTMDVTSLCDTDPEAGAILNTAGSSQAVTVTYEGKTASFAITVNPDETTVGPIITVDTNLGGKVVSSGSVDNGDGTYTVTVVVAPTTGFTVYNVYVSNGYTYETEGMPEDISDIVTAGNVTITIHGVTDSVDVDVTFVPLILDDDDDNPTNPPVVVDPKEDDNSVVIVAIAAGVVVAILAALILMHTRKN